MFSMDTALITTITTIVTTVVGGGFGLFVFISRKIDKSNEVIGRKIEGIKENIVPIHNTLFYSGVLGKEYEIQLKCNRYLRSQSPVSLTEEGCRKIEELGLKEYVDSNMDRLKKHFDDTENEKEVVIYDIAHKLAEELLDANNARNDKDMLEILEKNYQDNTSKYIIKDMLAVYLRDKVLEKRK